MTYTQDDHLFRDRDQYAAGKYAITLRWLKRESSGTMLVNIGCGAGDFNIAAARAGYFVSAFEPDPRAAEVATKKAPPGVEVSVGSLADAAKTHAKAPLVVLHDVLEHIEDDRGAAAALAGMIPSGGLLLVSVPACSWLFGKHDEELFHFRRYSKSSLLGLFEEEFEVKRIRWYGFLFIPITLIFSVFLRKPYPQPDGKRGLAYWIIRAFVAAEKRVPFPLGTSLLLLAKRR